MRRARGKVSGAVAGGVALALVSASPALAVFGLVGTFGSFGTNPGQFAEPTSVAAAPNGDVFVLDAITSEVKRFDATGAFLDEWGASGSGAGEFFAPKGIDTDPAGNVYVVDTGNHRVQKLEPDGTHLMTIGSQGSGDGQFQGPRDVTVDSAGTIFVLDTGNNRVQKFDSSGTFVAKFGGLGTAAGLFQSPFGIGVDDGDDVYVADTGNHRVQRFDGATGGHLLTVGGGPGSGDGQLDQPQDVTVDASGDVLTTDRANHRVVRFGATGAFEASYGQQGSADGSFDGPSGIDAATDDSIYVADRGNGRVQHFGESPRSITIVEDTQPDNNATFSFTTTGAGLTDFSLTDGVADPGPASKTFGALAAGQYTITETAVASYVLSSLTCDTAETVDLENRTVTIDLGADEHVTCTFVNQPAGSITITQTSLPPNAQSFGFDGDLGAFTLDDDGDQPPTPRTEVFANLVPGTYTITQDAVPNWPLVAVGGCDGEVVDLASRTITITRTDFENVGCTFFNTNYRPDALVRKQGDASFVGDDTYNGTGTGQTRTVKVKRGKAASFELTMENDATEAGVVDRPIVTGRPGGGKFKITYRDFLGNDVTDEVTGAGFVSTLLAQPQGGQGETMTVTVKVKRSAPKGKKQAVPVTMASFGASTSEVVVSDTVKAVVKVK